MSPRIVTISDHIDCPTGFGVQHRHLALGLARAGYDVHALGLWDTRPLASIADCRWPMADCRQQPACLPSANSAIANRQSQISLTRYPGGLGPDDHRRAWAMYRDLLRPDLVVTLGDLRTFAHLAHGRRPFAWCHWLPLDALPYPARDHATLLRLGRLVLMSHFALEAVRPHLDGRVPLALIPHGVDTLAFRPLGDPLALRRRWTEGANGRPPLRTLDGSPLRPDDFILIARDANQWRKQQPLLLEALSLLPRGVKLLFHCHPVAHPNARGWDLPRAAQLYGVADRVAFTAPVASPRTGVGGWGSGVGGPPMHGPRRTRKSSDPQPPTPNPQPPFLPLSPAELAELDNLADLRVSATMGEGFGVLTIEAMACGTPTVITDYTTSRELIEGRAPRTEESGVRCSVFGVGGPRADNSSAGTAPSAPHPQGVTPALSTRRPSEPEAPLPTPNTEHPTPNTVILDPFGPAGELVRVAAWTLEQERSLLRPIVDAADLAAKALALRDDPGRLARYAEAGLRRVLARYTVAHMVEAWSELALRIVGPPG